MKSNIHKCYEHPSLIASVGVPQPTGENSKVPKSLRGRTFGGWLPLEKTGALPKTQKRSGNLQGIFRWRIHFSPWSSFLVLFFSGYLSGEDSTGTPGVYDLLEQFLNKTLEKSFWAESKNVLFYIQVSNCYIIFT